MRRWRTRTTATSRAPSRCSREARALVEREGFSDIDRAEVLFRLGVCRYLLSSISTAVGLFNEALALAERSGLPSDSCA